ncbi:hypothetical protein X739_29775 [Mesorhizobium sp. LNHC220B00]|uniref:hypothetical protein n=1 Tax=Mesorhizobium sp. LNHC229A00 TaxID=1287240 RepID=UPI0003CF5BE2|nr:MULTISPECIES: hypothetical protein [unclassified Mesorhizobium]ESY79955.1 hypothetical protein X739_29775 [Mesorhizobium sp. LNHC220B00]ESY84702.1 hypothetical protein X741_33950 [Mesorhizobium sp. LNHC229A00]
MDSAKIQRLREHKIPAVEIDLSKLPRDSLRDAINEAVLKTATRRWLYHPGIEAARATYTRRLAIEKVQGPPAWVEAMQTSAALFALPAEAAANGTSSDAVTTVKRRSCIAANRS